MKNIFKRVVASLLVAVMLFGSAPIESLTGIDFSSLFAIEAEAAKEDEELNGTVLFTSVAADGYENAIFPMEYMYINQGECTGNHTWKKYNSEGAFSRYRYANDLTGKDGEIDGFYAPFTCVITDIDWDTASNSIFLKSKDPVHYADGRLQHMYITIGHDWYIDNLIALGEGAVIPQGTVFYQEGCKGIGTGNHIHMEIFTSMDLKSANSPVHIYDAFFVPTEGVKIKKPLYSNWRYLSKDEYTDNRDPYLSQKESEYAQYTANKSGFYMKKEPFADAENAVEAAVSKGQQFVVTGFIGDNGHGSKWYYTEYKGVQGWIYSGHLSKNPQQTLKPVVFEANYHDNNNVAAALDGRTHTKGKTFSVRGTLTSYTKNIVDVKATIYKTSLFGIVTSTACTGNLTNNSKICTLSKNGIIDNAMTFKSLGEGNYRLEISVKLDGSKDYIVVEKASFCVVDPNKTSQAEEIIDALKVILKKTDELVKPVEPDNKPSTDKTPVNNTVSAPTYNTGVYRTTSADNLNIRTGPGSGYSLATSAIPRSTEVEVTEISSNGWGKTVYNGKTGWICLKYATWIRALETVKKPDAPTVKLTSEANVPTGAIVGASWNAVANADTYTAYLKDSNGTVVDTSEGITGRSVSFTVSNAGKYHITVCAVNEKYSVESVASSSFTAHAPLTVSFVDWDGRTETRSVAYGSNAIAPDPPTREGYTFTGWEGNYEKVTTNLTIHAGYKINTYNVKFIDRDGNQLGSTQRINYGSSAVEPEDKNIPTGWVFVGWDTDEWTKVKRDLTVTASYKWGNDELPVMVTNVKADLISGGYNVTFNVSCTEAVTNGRAVVAIKTAEGKLISTTESEAFSLASGTSDYPKSIYTPADSPASIAEVYVVNSFKDAVPISSSKSCTIDLHDQWSDWSENKPADNLYNEIETKVQYKYRDKQFTTASSKTLSGWTHYDTTSTSSRGSSTSYVGAINTDAHKRTVSTWTETFYKTQYKYNHYRHPTQYTVSPVKYDKYTLHETAWMDKPYAISGTSNAGGATKYGSTSSTKCSCGCTHWYNQQTRQVEDYHITHYDYTDTYYTYYFWKWGGWSNWSDTPVSATSNREVNTRPLYRYKNTGFAAEENKDGVFRTVSGTLDASLAGEEATLFIYKIDEASDWTGEYVGQTVIAEDGSYSFTFKLREEPSIKTGDFTMSLGIEGTTEAITIGTISAPKPEYTVTFYNDDGSVIETQTVTEGEAAVTPANPEKEGYTFVGWDSDLSCIDSDINLTARYIKNSYTVVFVDWSNKTVVTKTFEYGDYLVPPEADEVDGYDLVRWGDVVLGETVVKDNMVITAEFAKKTYEVNFYDYENNLVSTQIVPYGETPSAVDITDKDNYVFIDWTSYDNGLENTSGAVNFYPTFVFEETVADPVSSLENGTYYETQTVELTTETENAIIYYTLDGSDPKEGGEEYAGPITIDRSVELRYYACAFEKNDSEVMNNYYAVNAGVMTSDWMEYADIPQYVLNDTETYTITTDEGYSCKDVIETSDYSYILQLENEGWTNNGSEFGEWSDWSLTEPIFDGLAYEVETRQPDPVTESRYRYVRFKYLDENGTAVYSAEEVEGVEGEWEEHISESKLSVGGFISGTTTPYYALNGEKWFSQTLVNVDVIPDYMMYRYRMKIFNLFKWSEWTVGEPSAEETRETKTAAIYQYHIPEMFIVNIIPDYSVFGSGSQTQIIVANEMLEIDKRDYDYEGYDFLGFFTDPEFATYWDYETQAVTSDLNLYPKYSAHTFDVIFVDYDSTVLSEQTVSYGEYAEVPEPEGRDGYVFIGWDTDAYEFTTENLIVTAVYVPQDEYCTVSLDRSKYYMMAGTSVQLNATVTPEDSLNKNLEWYTDNSSVITVTDDGVVTAIGEGIAIVSVVAEATGEYAECVITVTANPSESLCLNIGSTLTLDAENKLLRGVKHTVSTVASVKEQFANTDLVFTDINGNVLDEDAAVGTGTVISFSDGDTVIDSVNVVVTGDMTGDGLVNNRDAAMITRYLVEKETADFAQMVAIDVNGDGYINNRDASMVSRYLVGKETI
ncbi:MAG: InlB B-repeat-containing protein [Clostridia bacterium]|nr:InlB B-repeat-containing protein [Clostridia bacterium]